MKHHPLRLGRVDAGDPKFGKALPVAFGATVVLASLLLEHDHGSGPALIDDFRGDFSPRDQGLTDDDTLVPVNQSNVVELHGAAHFSRKALDLDEAALFYSVLLAACFYDSVHEPHPP